MNKHPPFLDIKLASSSLRLTPWFTSSSGWGKDFIWLVRGAERAWRGCSGRPLSGWGGADLPSSWKGAGWGRPRQLLDRAARSTHTQIPLFIAVRGGKEKTEVS